EVTVFPNATADYSVKSWGRNPGTKLESLDLMLQALYGRLPYDGGRDFVANLRSEKESGATDEQIGSYPVKRIRTNGAYGAYSVSLDFTAGNAPRRIEVLKVPHHLFAGRPLRNYQGSRDPSSRYP